MLHLLQPLIVLWSLIARTNGQLTCNNAYSCYNGNYTLTGRVRCYGSFSCAEGTLLSTNYISCSGSHACVNMSLLQHAGGGSRGIECRGLESCANIKKMITSGYIQCGAEQACSNSMINYTDTAYNYLDCSGDRSCWNVVSQGGTDREHYLYANLAALNATLYSGINTSDVNYYFYGGYSGYNATIICQEDTSCNVVCNGTSCNQASLCCENGCNVTIDCDYAQKSEICPNGM